MNNGISRSRQNRILGGVASGIGKYLQVDPIIIRILFVITAFFDGIGILLYIIMWIVVPEEALVFNTPNDSQSSDTTSSKTSKSDEINFESFSEKKNNRSVLFGLILIIGGFLLLGVEIFSFLNFEDLFPLILIGLGSVLLWKSKKS